jgi:hypothetical protein
VKPCVSLETLANIVRSTANFVHRRPYGTPLVFFNATALPATGGVSPVQRGWTTRRLWSRVGVPPQQPALGGRAFVYSDNRLGSALQSGGGAKPTSLLA